MDFAIFGQNAPKCVTLTLFAPKRARSKGCVIHRETRDSLLYPNPEEALISLSRKKFRGRLNAKNAHFGHLTPILGVIPYFFILENHFFGIPDFFP